MVIMPENDQKTLTEWFDRVYLINCAHRPDRLTRCMTHLKETGMSNMDKIQVYK